MPFPHQRGSKHIKILRRAEGRSCQNSPAEQRRFAVRGTVYQSPYMTNAIIFWKSEGSESFRSSSLM